MFTVASIISILTTVATNMPSFVALGVDVIDVFNKGKALVSSDVASTPAERAAALATIDDLETQFEAGLEALRLSAPNS